MIDWKQTKVKMGYDEDYFNKYPKSDKKVYAICDKCNKCRLLSYRKSHKLCMICSRSGKNHYNYNKHRSEETKAKISKTKNGRFLTDKTKEKISESMPNRNGKLNPNWKGGFDNKRPWILPENQCIKLNQKFNNCEGHHIMKNIIIYLPKELHKMNHHDLKNNKGMNEINKLAMNYLVGDI